MILRVADMNYKPKQYQPVPTHKVKKLSSHERTIKQQEYYSRVNNKTYWQEMKELHETLGDSNGKFDGIMNAWKNEPCFVVGTSRAIEGFDFNLLNGLHTIGINHLIEDWDLMEWFVYLDERFLSKTTYNMDNYQGKVFANNSTNIINKKNYVRFKQIFRTKENIGLNIAEGLFGRMTGVCALHLALIAGANPIYLLGMDTLKEDAIKKGTVSHHYKEDYNHERKERNYLGKYIGSEKDFLKFSPWKDRIINVCENGTMPNIFKRISKDKLIEDINKIKGKQNIKSDQQTICHITNFENINDMNEISRQIFELTDGKHIRANLSSSVYPDADIYLLECILRDKEKFMNWKAPKGKLISLVHSGNVYSKYSDKIVTLTNSQEIQGETIIPCAIDMKYYNYDIDYNNNVFGRITAYSRGKVHAEFENVVKRVQYKTNSSCIMICNNIKEDQKKDYIKYIIDINRNDNEKKASALAKMSIFADMHGAYKETFSISLLEAMASGLAIVLYSTIDQPAMKEVLGDCGITCKTIEEFENKLIWLLENPDIKKEYGLKAKERAKLFSIENMVNKWNKLFEELK
jgi:glycosyltransferase involved in cell wall biosynthesis